ncbi:MAG: PhoU domain-containing protein [bacterium]
MLRFKEVYELWRKDNSLTQALNDSKTMLESTFEMFRESSKSLRESDSGDIGSHVYERDEMVNEYERTVRRKVLKHLAITGGINIIPGLILTTIVIDIERIGDYTKNIMDLAVAHPKRLKCGEFEDDIKKIESTVSKVFQSLPPMITSSSKEKARKLITENRWVLRLCDKIDTDLIKEKDETLGSGDAVSCALYTRYLKRIAAHLINIASSIVNPFERIGFWEEGDGT